MRTLAVLAGMTLVGMGGAVPAVAGQIVPIQPVPDDVAGSLGVPEHFLAILGVLLFFGLLLPRLLRPLRLPFATSLILVGSLMGPHGLALVAPDASLALFGFLGATFYMLLAGTESRTLGIGASDPATARMVLLTSVIPGAVGVGITRTFGYDWTAALFVGTVFLSSSIMVVFGTVGALQLDKTPAGQLVKRVAVVEDLAAALLAFLLFQTVDPNLRFPLPILAGLLLSSVVLLRMFLPEVVAFFFTRFEERGGDDHEARLRLVIALFLLVIFAYSALDVHPVIAAFLVGFALADVPTAPAVRESLETMGYGLFIPVFLFVVGLDTDLRVLTRLDPANLLVMAVLTGAVGSKLVSGFLGARWAGLESREAWVAAVSSTAKLAVPLTATYAARDLGILDAELFSAIVVTAIATSVLAPLLASLISRPSASAASA